MRTINRRDLLLFGAASAGSSLIVFPTITHAVIPPPPISPWYLIFIADGIYKISNLYVVDLPPEAGTAQNYSVTGVNYYFGANFTFTQRTGTSAWHMLLNAPSYKWWEYLDKRTGKYVRIYLGDRIEARFADKSRVKVVFGGQNAVYRFQPLVGTERLPDGTRLYPREPHSGGGGGGKGRGDHGSVTPVTPGVGMFAWHFSSQEVPW